MGEAVLEEDVPVVEEKLFLANTQQTSHQGIQSLRKNNSGGASQSRSYFESQTFVGVEIERLWVQAYWNVDKLQEEWSTMRVGDRKMQKEWRREERAEDGGRKSNRVWSLPKNASFWNWGQMSSGKASPQNFSDTARWLRFSPPASECNSSLSNIYFRSNTITVMF